MRHDPVLAFALIWVSLGLGITGCVAKPGFHCQNDAACVSSDGIKGTCEASGECTFPSQPGDHGGAGGAGDVGGDSGSNPTAGSSGDGVASGGSSGTGHGGNTGAIGSAGDGDAGASCTDEANDCYVCRPKTSEQFLNACTSSACVPFDDHARVTRMSASGTLPPLPVPTGL